MAKNYGYDGQDLEIDSLESDSLCIFVADGHDSSLAYCTNIGGFEIIIDANNADVLFVSRTVYEETATGYTASDTTRSNGFSIEQLGEHYYVMSDTSRGLSVYTFAGRISQDNEGFHRDRATIVESTDEVFGNTEAEATLEYEKGAQLLLNVSAIHDYFSSLGFSSSATNIDLYYNDGYDGGENALGGKTDGYGGISMGTVTGVNCIDVIAHEYTHFVNRELVGWIGKAENGALNEAISDIFGEIVESFVTGNDIDWQMYNSRNIADPSAQNYPCVYKGDNWGDTLYPIKDNDYGYVHRNSTVISHTAYLMWNGIDGTDSKKISTNDLAELWYRAMLMMPSDCNFGDCRHLVELAATSMELTTDQIACISEAFDAVGITGAAKESFAALYDLTLDSTLSVYSGKDILYDNYTLTITGNTTIYGPVIEKVDSSYNRTRTITSAEPYELNLPQGVYEFTITDNANPKATHTFTVCIWDDEGDANLDVFTNFGCTPVTGIVSEIRDVDGVDTNIPATNAVVEVYAGDTLVDTAQISDTEGIFQFFLPVGTYSVIVEAEGYQTASTTFNVDAQEDVYLPISLTSSVYVDDVYSQATKIDDWLYCYHIPQVHLSGNYADAINASLYDQLNRLITEQVTQPMEASGYPTLSEMVYTWGQKNGLVSIIVQTNETYVANTQFYVYNISAGTGAEVDNNTLYQAYGLTQRSFYELVRATMEKYWDLREIDLMPQVGETLFQSLIDRTLTDDNIRASIPYINQRGELCIVARLASPAGADSYLHLLNTTTGAEEDWIRCEKDHSDDLTARLEAWNQAYYDYIVQDINGTEPSVDLDFVGYELIYLDEDTIPELWIDYGILASGCRIVSYQDGTLVERLLSSSTLSYIEHGGVFNASSGHQGVYFDTIIRLANGALETVAKGENRAKTGESGVPNYEEMEYFWNDTPVSEEAYYQSLSALVPPENSKTTSYEAQRTFSDMVAYLSSISAAG